MQRALREGQFLRHPLIGRLVSSADQRHQRGVRTDFQTCRGSFFDMPTYKHDAQKTKAPVGETSLTGGDPCFGQGPEAIRLPETWAVDTGFFWSSQRDKDRLPHRRVIWSCCDTGIHKKCKIGMKSKRRFMWRDWARSVLRQMFWVCIIRQ